MSEDFDKYLAIANQDIQAAKNMGELKSYVASILWDNDKKVELLQQKENIIKEVREYIKDNCILSDTWEELENHQFVPTGRINYKSLSSKKIKELLKILYKEVN